MSLARTPIPAVRPLARPRRGCGSGRVHLLGDLPRAPGAGAALDVGGAPPPPGDFAGGRGNPLGAARWDVPLTAARRRVRELGQPHVAII